MAVTLATFGQLPSTIPPMPRIADCFVTVSRPHKGVTYNAVTCRTTGKIWILDDNGSGVVAHFPSATSATKRIMGVSENTGKVTSINGRGFFNLPAAESAIPAPAVVIPPTPPQPVKVVAPVIWPELIRKTLARIHAKFINIFWVGPSGCGKSHLASILADALKARDFEPIACGPETSESKFFGRPTADGKWVETRFLEIFEKGGVVLLDEMPKLVPGVAATLNMALANGIVSVGGKVYRRHKDTIILGTGNSFGRGSKTYATDAPQDVAYVDRFIGAVLPVDYDHAYEAKVVANVPMGAEYLAWSRIIRGRVLADAKCGRVVSTRWIQSGALLLKAGATLAETREAMLVGWTPDEITRFVP